MAAMTRRDEPRLGVGDVAHQLEQLLLADGRLRLQDLLEPALLVQLLEDQVEEVDDGDGDARCAQTRAARSPTIRRALSSSCGS